MGELASVYAVLLYSNGGRLNRNPARKSGSVAAAIETDYKDLSEEEKQSDRDVVMKYFAVLPFVDV